MQTSSIFLGVRDVLPCIFLVPVSTELLLLRAAIGISSLSKEGIDTVGDDGDSFTFGTGLGLVFIVQAAFLSLLSVLALLIYIGFAAIKIKGRRRRLWTISTPLHAYFISLLFAELFQATGAIMNLKWVEAASVGSGTFCVAQGIIKQIGDVSVALCTLAIAIHTFTAIVFRWSPPNRWALSVIVLSIIWLIVALMIIISVVTHRNNIDDYWSDTQYWCWIAKRYKLQQYLLDYVFMWATAFANIILYIPMALVIKGVFTVNGRRIKYKRPEEREHISTQGSAGSGKGIDKAAWQMLFYPAVYTLTILPIAIVRFRGFHDEHVPFAYTVAADVLFCCSGFFNVGLFGFTRPSLLPRRVVPLQSSDHTFNQFSFSLRTPTVDQLRSTRPSMPRRSPMGALPDDSEIYRLESRSYHDYDIDSIGVPPLKARSSPSISSFRSQSGLE